jgi:hypothetical protein
MKPPCHACRELLLFFTGEQMAAAAFDSPGYFERLKVVGVPEEEVKAQVFVCRQDARKLRYPPARLCEPWRAFANAYAHAMPGKAKSREAF